MDCDVCGYAPLSPDEEERQRPYREHMDAAIRRMTEAYIQMQQRSGPYYELSRERSRIVSEAYRAAGSPRKVFLRHGADGELRYFFARQRPVPNPEPATKADADAWYAWWRERDRLRRDLGSSRGQPRPATLRPPGHAAARS